jgi:hypothetical protein
MRNNSLPRSRVCAIKLLLKVVTSIAVNYPSSNRLILVLLFCICISPVWKEKLFKLIQIYSYIKIKGFDVFRHGFIKKHMLYEIQTKAESKTNGFI